MNSKRAYKRLYQVLILLLPVLLLQSCSKEEAPVSASGSDIQEVEVTRVERKILNRIDQLPAEIRAYQDVAVYPKVPGFIEKIEVDRGSKVKKGQLLCTLTAPELMAQRSEARAKSKSAEGMLAEARSKLAAAHASLLEAKAQLAGDNDTYTRTKEASAVPGVVAPNDVVVLLEKVKADEERVRVWQDNIKTAENSVRALGEAYQASQKAAENYKDIADYLVVRAPFDGYITERNLHVGSFVGPLGQGAYPCIVRIQELGLLRIITPVPEANVGGVLAGAPVDFTVSSYPGEHFRGNVARIGNALEQKTRTMPVELNYLNPGWRILPGMFCEVLWPTRREKPSFFLPPTAVETTSTLATFVARIKNNEVEWVPVTRGEMMGGLAEVFGGLAEGDMVVLRCSDALKPHTKVKPVEVAYKEQGERPPYITHGDFYSAPDSERKELAEPQNKDKPKAY